MRAFVGIPISQELKVKIFVIQKRFRDFDIKLVEKENLHFNLKFLKEVPQEKIHDIRQSLEKAMGFLAPFEINIQGIGIFPSENYIRVVWLGIKQGYQEMLGLQQAIERAFENVGIEREKVQFQPHLTLGRVKSAKNKADILKLLEKYQDTEVGTMKIDRIVFFESVLTGQGPVYNEVFSVNLE